MPDLADPHLVLLPVLTPLVGAAVCLLLRHQPVLRGWVALLAQCVALLASVALLWQVWGTGQPIVFAVGGWVAPFGIVLVADLLGAVMALMCQVVLVAGVLYSLGAGDKCIGYPSYYALLLTLGTGLTGAMLTGDLFNLFVFAELLVISATVLTATSDNKAGAEAAYKYFYVSQLAAILLLVGCGCLYAGYGTLNMADLAVQVAQQPEVPLGKVAMGLLIAAFAIKSAMVPFHFWQPDFHTTAPTAVSAMLSSVVVKLGLYGLIRMTTLLYPHEAPMIQSAMLVMGGAGVLLGGLSALGTHDLKRMLAYSTLAQIGFMLMAVGWGTPMALAAALVFAVNHALAKSAMLMIAGAIASRSPVKSSSFEVVVGVGGKAAPWAGVLFVLGGMALVGLPPTNGFISKLSVFSAGVEAQRWATLALLAVGSGLTFMYVFRGFARVWWEPMPEQAKPKPTGDAWWAPAVLIACCVLLGVWAEPMLELMQAVSAATLDVPGYVSAVFSGTPGIDGGELP